MAGAAFEAARRRLSPVIVAQLAGLALALVAAAPLGAHAEAQLVPAYPDAPLNGPAHAKGAVIWSHGKGSGEDEAKAANPEYLALLRDAGWDVYRNNRLGELDEYKEPRPSVAAQVRSKTEELAKGVDKLEAEGYRRIVLAGQSFGAWLTLNLADKRSDIYAVIATSPAAYGTRQRNPQHYENNGRYLGDLIDDLGVKRVMLSFFRDDPYDPGGRGPAADASLARHRIPHLVIDQPEIPTGHGGANGLFFARRFGPCVVALVEAPQVPALAECANGKALEPSGAVPLPPGLKLATPSGAPGSDPFLGEWWGLYGNGREMILAVERIEGERVQAIYAYGPQESQKGGFVEITGRLAEGRLVFAEPGKPRFEYRLEPDGRLQATWSKGDTTLAASLRRLSP